MPTNTLLSWSGAVDEVILRLGNRTDIDTRAELWLNTAQYLFAKCWLDNTDFDETSTFYTNSGQAEYGLDSVVAAITDIIGIECVTSQDDTLTTPVIFKMQRFPWQEYRALSQLGSGQPSQWTRRGTTMAFSPEPDDSYLITVDYRRMPQQGVIEIDPGSQEWLLKVATWVGWSALQQSDRATEVLRELPSTVQALFQQPLSQNQWEAMADQDLRLLPMGFDETWYR